ncbi:hypothetical protein F4781DRAFT_442532 [Annulohypoxylon bovei var. microspora]|nr:hypothetical protein F4781DRAFT_442532 [Annulohypoxylon bovei var. microspora]
MASGPKRQPGRSQTLLQGLEDDLRVGVFDQGDGPYNGDPELIVPNGRSGCFGLYLITPDGVEFIFHHATMKHATTCDCLTKMNPGDTTFQIPAELDDHRLRLMQQRPYRMGPKLAAMVIMKLFLGLEVPEPLCIKQKIENEYVNIETQAEPESNTST